MVPPHILVVGSLNMDLVMRVPRFPRRGESVIGSGFRAIPGGKGANQAVAAARLGARVTMIGRVGADDYGRSMRAGLEAEGIDVGDVAEDPDASSGIALITLEPGGQNCIAVDPGANQMLTGDHVREAWARIERPELLVMPLETSLESVEKAAELASRAGIRVVFNAAPPPSLPLSDELLHRVDLLIVNETEARALTGRSVETDEQIADAAQRLLDRGVRAVILTLGERGALALENVETGPRRIAAHSVDVVDTVAAGDAFVGGLAVGLSEGTDVMDAGRLASATAAIAVSCHGAQPSLPRRDEVNQLLV